MDTYATFTIGKGVLLPEDDIAKGLIAKLKVGDRVLMNVRKPRSVSHHRLAFTVLQRIADANGRTVDVVLTWLKVALGKVDFVQLPNGKAVACPQSVSFSAMGQTEFSAFWRDALPLIFEHLLPGLPEAEYQEIRDIIEGAEREP